MRSTRTLLAAAAIALLIAACGSSNTSDNTLGNPVTVTVTTPGQTSPTTSTSTSAATTSTKTATTGTTTTGAAGSTYCNVDDLSASSLGLNGAAGTQILVFALKNVGSSACLTGGWPGIAFLAADGSVLPTTPTRVTHDVLGTLTNSAITLAPGDEASFRITVSDSVDGGLHCVNSPKIEITPPNDEYNLKLALSPAAPTCGEATVSPLQSGTGAQAPGQSDDGGSGT